MPAGSRCHRPRRIGTGSKVERNFFSRALSLELQPKRENWQNIIEQIEASIKDLDKLTKGDHKEHKQEFYSSIAMEFRYIKNTWRNHVMHNRVDYDQNTATDVWWHVQRMLGGAAKQLQEYVE
jgi:hypothetical protein